MSVLLKLNCSFNTIPIKISADFYGRNRKDGFKMHLEMQNTWPAKSIQLKKKKKFGGDLLHSFRNNQKDRN